jgi:hypothetical protein
MFRCSRWLPILCFSPFFSQWVESLIPPFIQDNIHSSSSFMSDDSDEKQTNKGLPLFDSFIPDERSPRLLLVLVLIAALLLPSDVDHQTVQQAYCYIIAACCFSLGLRYAVCFRLFDFWLFSICFSFHPL